MEISEIWDRAAGRETLISFRYFTLILKKRWAQAVSIHGKRMETIQCLEIPLKANNVKQDKEQNETEYFEFDTEIK